MRYLGLVLCIFLVWNPVQAFEAPMKMEEEPPYAHHAWVEETPQRPIPKHKNRTLILSIDGGGIRGVIPALLLDHLEKKLSAELKADIRIADFFDIMAGTSTGSIIALGLSTPEEGHRYRPKYPAKTLVELYRDKGGEIFPETRWWHSDFWTQSLQSFLKAKYSPLPLEEELDYQLEDLKISQGLHGTHLLIPAFNLTSRGAHIFDSYGIQEEVHDYHKDRSDADDKPSPLDYKMCHVARASSAAPTYFPAMKIYEEHYIDGGVFMNNPAAFAYARSQEIYPDIPVIMISLGTGQSSQPAWDAEKLADGGKLSWASAFPAVAMQGVADTTHQSLKMHSSSSQLQYYRLQAELENDSLDDARPEALQGLIRAAEKLLTSLEFEEIYQTLKNCFIERNHPLKERIQHLTQHTHLDLQYLWFADPDWEPFSKALNSTQHLTHITLRRCGINAERIQPICQGLSRHKNLIYLDLSENDIGGGMNHVGLFLVKHGNIQFLNLNFNSITFGHPEICQCFVKTVSGQPSTLKALSLSGNPLGTEGVYFLFSTLAASSKHKADLNVLLLESVGLTLGIGIESRLWAQQFAALVQAFPKDGFCSLYGNNIGRELKSTLHEQHTPILNFYTSFTLKENLP